MLGGALALYAYAGIWRDTKDIDVFVLGRDVAEALGRVGFETEILELHWLAKAWKGGLFVDIIHANDSGRGLRAPPDQRRFGRISFS